MGIEWIGFDLDGTLAEYHGWSDEIGPPIPGMIKIVKAYLEAGRDVRIVTARVNPNCYKPAGLEYFQVAIPIMEWCKEHIGQILPVTCSKDCDMEVLYDDRCIQVEKNTGKLITRSRDDVDG